jgi:hypothetical protein
MDIVSRQVTPAEQFVTSRAAEAAYLKAAYAPDFYGDMDQFAGELAHAGNVYWEGYFRLSLDSSMRVLEKMDSIRKSAYK